MTGACVITTIQSPTPAIRAWAERFPGRLIVIGDRKTPAGWICEGANYHAIEDQIGLGFASAPHLARDHYARKNVGYLLAMGAGAPFIYDTDDDNMPTSTWRVRGDVCLVDEIDTPSWCNVYRLLGADRSWPRGFALRHVRDAVPGVTCAGATRLCLVQQGLVAGDPDVDAIWRLTQNDEVSFAASGSVALGAGTWCPFNSQTTWWYPEAYPLLYLPSHAPFRMTDVWRSFVAQRCLWALGSRVAHHAPPEVFQRRNQHDPLVDFADEIPGYLHNEEFVAALESVHLPPGQTAAQHLATCYEALVNHGFVPPAELPIVRAWCDDARNATGGRL